MTHNNSIDFTRVFDLLDYQFHKYPQEKAVLSFSNDTWEATSIQKLKQRADFVSGWLIEQGFVKGDRLAIVPKMGSPEWMMLDFGCQQVGVVIVPVHPTSSAAETEFILQETEVKACITADRSLFEKVNSLKNRLPSLRIINHLEMGSEGELVLLTGDGMVVAVNKELEERKKQVNPEDILAIMYTSGTSGTPKGAVLSHGNVANNVKSMLTLLPLQPGDRALSFLPFSHIFERTSCYGYLAFGVSIHFTKSLEFLKRDFNSVQPFFCTCVPRTLEKMYDYLQEQREEKNLIKRRVIGWAMQIGARYKDTGLGIGYHVQLFVARMLVLNTWRKSLGGRLRYMAVGAAALRPEIGKMFSAAGIMTLSGYGMTEASPFIAVNRYLPGLNRLGTVGIPIPGVDLKIDQPNELGEGEILVKGPNIMRGYFNRPELNAEVFTSDGWFKTGDVGKMVAKRFLAITDRKKDIFKTTTGKYVAPQTVQNHFTTSSLISQCLVMGFNKPYVTAILVPHFEILKAWCEDHGIHWTSPQFMVHNIKVVKKFQDETDRLNEDLQAHERVRKFVISDEEWTVENKELTTSFKPMRTNLVEKHKGQIDKLYS